MQVCRTHAIWSFMINVDAQQPDPQKSKPPSGCQGNPFRNLWDLWYSNIVFEGSRIPCESSRVPEAPDPS